MQAVLKLASHVCAVTGNRTLANREMKRPRPVLQPERGLSQAMTRPWGDL